MFRNSKKVEMFENREEMKKVEERSFYLKHFGADPEK